MQLQLPKFEWNKNDRLEKSTEVTNSLARMTEDACRNRPPTETEKDTWSSVKSIVYSLPLTNTIIVPFTALTVHSLFFGKMNLNTNKTGVSEGSAQTTNTGMWQSIKDAFITAPFLLVVWWFLSAIIFFIAKPWIERHQEGKEQRALLRMQFEIWTKMMEITEAIEKNKRTKGSSESDTRTAETQKPADDVAGAHARPNLKEKKDGEKEPILFVQIGTSPATFIPLRKIDRHNYSDLERWESDQTELGFYGTEFDYRFVSRKKGSTELDVGVDGTYREVRAETSVTCRVFGIWDQSES